METLTMNKVHFTQVVEEPQEKSKRQLRKEKRLDKKEKNRLYIQRTNALYGFLIIIAVVILFFTNPKEQDFRALLASEYSSTLSTDLPADEFYYDLFEGLGQEYHVEAKDWYVVTAYIVDVGDSQTSYIGFFGHVYNLDAY
jgi:hypothetical protein